MKKKRLLLVAVLVFVQIFFAACTPGCSAPRGGESENAGNSSGAESVNETSLPGESDSESKEGESVGTTDPSTKPANDYSETSSVEFVGHMGLGWNLGNAFENNLSGYPDSEYGNSIVKELGFDSREMFCEVRNQQDIYRGAVTPSTIKAVYDKGFRSIRIPVSWSNHMGENGIIHKVWLGRIREVVDYIFEYDDMFAILNIMDTPNIGAYYLDDIHYEKTKSLVINVWEQLSETFKDYDERLIFENLNEPLHSKLGWSMSPQSNRAEYKECIKNINEFNQLYVDIVRGQGSECNARRFLSVGGYGNTGYLTYDAAINAIAAFRMPEDKTEDRLLMNIHAYVPNGFSFGRDSSWDEASDESDPSGIKAMFTAIGNAYTKKGVGVIVSEWGSVYKNQRGYESYRKKHAAYFVKNATENGVCVMVWDNNTRSTSWSTEYFGLLNRHKASGLYGDMENLSGVKYDNNSLWFSEGVIDGMFEGLALGLNKE